MWCCRRYPLLVWLFFWLLIGSATGQQRPGPFTKSPRSVRSRDVDQQHIRLELRFDWDKQEVQGKARLELKPFKPIESLTLDAAEMQIVRVGVETTGAQPGLRELKHQYQGQTLGIQLDRQYRPDESLVLVVEYGLVRPRHGAHFVVPDESEPNQRRMVWTQSEPEFAHYWFPCIDSPSDRMTSEIFATVPTSYQVLSNGELKGKTEHEDGTITVHWQQQQSHVPYLMSVVAGEFDEYKQQWEGIPVLSYVAKGRLADAPRSFEKTPAMVEYFSRQIGVKYPWPKYAQICVDEYMWGGMEHTSATTLTDRTLHDERAHLDEKSDSLVAHELAHQWFGDLLTCKDWGEIWLNESFAMYCATLWQEKDEGWDEAAWTRYREAQRYLEEDKRYRRSIVNYRYDTPDNMFDGHSYPKGGRVLHLLRFVLGDELFWKAIRQYVSVNQHRTVETADLRRAIEDATGQGLNWFFDEWIHHGGHPEFDVAWSWDAEARSVRLTVKQLQMVDQVTPLFRLPVEIELASHQQVQIRRIEISKAEESFHFQCEERPTRVCFDPRDWVLKTLVFEKSKEELLDQLAHDSNVIARVQAAQGLAGFVQDKDAQAALRWSARKDSFWAVRQEAVKALAKHNADEIRKTLIEAAADDPKSFVRREALSGLANFKHQETNAALRRTMANDKSYFAIAEALRSLVKVDRDNCASELLAAAAMDSHEQVILKAAVDGLVELKHPQADERLIGLLQQPASPERKAVLISGLARLKPENKDALERLYKELDNDRTHVRRVAINALVAIGDPAAIAVLLEKRKNEESPRMIRALDTAVDKLRTKERSLDQLQKELTELRDQNKRLEERLRALEQKK